MRKILFLDVDGCINSDETAEKFHRETGGGGFGGHFSEETEATKANVLWGEDLVANLKHIIDNTGAEIVISSTWRKHFSVNKFKEMFRLYGWDAPVIDLTVDLNTRLSGRGNRGLEVNEWLSRNPCKYVIIDDDHDFLPDQDEFFVHVNFVSGLRMEDAEEAIKILNK